MGYEVEYEQCDVRYPDQIASFKKVIAISLPRPVPPPVIKIFFPDRKFDLNPDINPPDASVMEYLFSGYFDDHNLLRLDV